LQQSTPAYSVAARKDCSRAGLSNFGTSWCVETTFHRTRKSVTQSTKKYISLFAFGKCNESYHLSTLPMTIILWGKIDWGKSTFRYSNKRSNTGCENRKMKNASERK
jgi:hypothetical protein